MRDEKDSSNGEGILRWKSSSESIRFHKTAHYPMKIPFFHWIWRLIMCYSNVFLAFDGTPHLEQSLFTFCVNVM